jgi:hypothetical protein
MDRELVVELARAAGAHDNGSEFRFVELRYLERFATLVAAAEREECAELCEVRAQAWAGVTANTSQREAFALRQLSEAIRARGAT